MTFEVRFGAYLMDKAARMFPEERTVAGGPSEYDFVSGPLGAARRAFTDFDRLGEELGPAIRSYHTVDPFFGAVVFAGVLIAPGTVEIADFDVDPDYQGLIDDDPGS